MASDRSPGRERDRTIARVGVVGAVAAGTVLEPVRHVEGGQHLDEELRRRAEQLRECRLERVSASTSGSTVW